MNKLASELKTLYGDTSKHSNYQNVPAFVTKALGYQEKIDEDWRGDAPRLSYIQRSIQTQRATVWGDLGANTGFFTLSLANQYPQTQFVSIEANQTHSEFISKIATHFGMGNVKSTNKSIGLDNLQELGYLDVLLHLNVLHHAGDDFDSHHVSGPSDFSNYALTYLEKLRLQTKTLVFQMGSNLWGNKGLPFVEYNNEIPKLALFSSYLLNSGWTICDIAYPARDNRSQILYKSLPEHLLEIVNARGVSGTGSDLATWLSKLNLDQFPGEFYRRPIFVCSAI